MCRLKVTRTPKLIEYTMYSSRLRKELEPLRLKHLFLWDANYYYVSHEDWGKVFADVLLNMPKYTVSKFDCENFAMLTTARVLERYELNTCGIAIGQSPLGYHGWNIFLSDAGLFYLEPQTSMIYDIKEDSGYQAEIVILG